MAELLEEPVRSEHEVDTTVQSEHEVTIEEEIRLARDLPEAGELHSVFGEFLDPEVVEPPAQEGELEADFIEEEEVVDIKKVADTIVKAVSEGKELDGLLRNLNSEDYNNVVIEVDERIDELVKKDALAGGEMTPEMKRRAAYALNHNTTLFDSTDQKVLEYISDVNATLALEAIDRGQSVRGAAASVRLSILAEKKLVSMILEDLNDKIAKDTLDVEKVKLRVDYLIYNISDEERNALPEKTKAFLLEFERNQMKDDFIDADEAGYFARYGFQDLEAEDRSYILNSMKEEVSAFLETKEGDVKRIESQARILLRATTDEDRKDWPKALKDYVEAPHHDYTHLPAEEQFERLYKNITHSYLKPHEFRSQMAKLPVDIQEKLLEKVLEDSTAYAEGKIGGSMFQSGRLKNGIELAYILGKDFKESDALRNKLEIDLAKGRVHTNSLVDQRSKGEFPFFGIDHRIETMLKEIKDTRSPEAKKIYLDHIQDYELSFLGDTKSLEKVLKQRSAEDELMATEPKDPSTILLRDKKTTLKEFLLKQENIEERKDGSLFVKDGDGAEFDIVTSYAKHSDDTEAWYIKVVSKTDSLMFKVLELNEFQEKMKHGGVAQMIVDAKKSRAEEVSNKGVLEKYDLPMDEKTAVIRGYPVVPDDVITPYLNHGHHMATALRARYGEAVDIKPLTFGKDMMLKQIDEAYKDGTKSFFVNAYGHGGKHGEWGEGIHLDDGQFKAEDIQKLLEEYPDAHFIINTNGCHGGGLAAGVEAFMKDKPELAKRLIVMTRTKPDIVNYGGQLGGAYEATFIKSIYNGDTFGKAIRNADIENKKQRSIDADTIIHGIKIGDSRPIRGEDIIA